VLVATAMLTLIGFNAVVVANLLSQPGAAGAIPATRRCTQSMTLPSA